MDYLKELENRGISVSSVFVPFSKSRNAGEPRKTLNWKVTLNYNGREILTTDYSAGEAHCPGYKAYPGDTRGGHERRLRIERECESGRAARGFDSDGAAIMPDAASVVYSLIVDSNVIDYATYDYWAADFGYDPDSIRGEKIYRQCLELALRMRAGIGETMMQDLRELFADY